MSPEAWAGIIAAVVSVLVSAGGFLISFGRFSSKIDDLTKHVDSLNGTKETIASFGARIGNLETDTRAMSAHPAQIAAIQAQLANVSNDLLELKRIVARRHR